MLIDLLTDSGTGAMSRDQWAAIQHGDESYAGSPSYYVFRDAVRELFPFEHVIPTHQGRAAEKILFTRRSAAREGGAEQHPLRHDPGQRRVHRAQAVDLVIAEGRDPRPTTRSRGTWTSRRWTRCCASAGDDVPWSCVTITNNTGGGQPVSLANLHAVREVCDAHGKPLFLDACRFAENAWFIQRARAGAGRPGGADIVREMAALADGMTMSAKKDPMGNIGGWLAMNDDELAEQCRNLLILTEGFPTYGGLAGRDLEAIAQGLREVVDTTTCATGSARRRTSARRSLRPGSRASSRSAATRSTSTRGRCCPHIPPLEYPGQALAVALYQAGGIRGCEIGTVMFGCQPDGSEAPGPDGPGAARDPAPDVHPEPHRLRDRGLRATSRQRRRRCAGYRIVDEPPPLRHFTATFAPLG